MTDRYHARWLNSSVYGLKKKVASARFPRVPFWFAPWSHTGSSKLDGRPVPHGLSHTHPPFPPAGSLVKLNGHQVVDPVCTPFAQPAADCSGSWQIPLEAALVNGTALVPPPVRPGSPAPVIPPAVSDTAGMKKSRCTAYPPCLPVKKYGTPGALKHLEIAEDASFGGAALQRQPLGSPVLLTLNEHQDFQQPVNPSRSPRA